MASTVTTKKPLSTNNTNSLFNKYSRYVGGGTTETANGYIEWWERFNFPRDTSDHVYVVENFYENRLDLISAVFYSEPRYWWFLAQYNNILDPSSEVTAGRVLLIPTATRLPTLLGTKKGGNPSTREAVNLIAPIIT
jgi:hypothetical protein